MNFGNGASGSNKNNIDNKYELSIRTDGRLSIEHQLSIHVNDLIDVYREEVPAGNEHDDSTKNEEQGMKSSEISLMDVLAGLRYVMDYRIKGGKQPNLDGEMMQKLSEGLLLHMKHRQRAGFLKQRFTEESNVSFNLFADFAEEVEEFRRAVSAIPPTDLAYSLMLNRRLKDPQLKDDVVNMLLILTTHLPDIFSVHELVTQDADEVKQLVDELGPSILKRQNQRKTALKQNQQELFPPPSLYSDRRIKRVIDMYKTSVANGLTSERVERLREHYGPNVLPKPKTVTALSMLWTQISDFMVVLLIAAGVVSAAFGDFKSTVVLMIVVVINVIIGFVQEFQANKALNALLSLSVPQATVMRDGEKQSIDSQQLVPGDVVVLEEGDAIPADLRLIETAQLEIIESILTGESVAVVKSPDEIKTRTRKLPLGDCKGNAFMSTVVARGRGIGIVVRTGDKTEIGKISYAIVNTKDVKTPMQVRLATLGYILVGLSVALCALIIGIGIARNQDTFEMIKLGVSLAVSVIPEGLVAVTVVTMAIGVKRMAAQSAIIRKLAGVESLGSVTVICSDKTGTLTEGNMSVSQLWTSDGEKYQFEGGLGTFDGRIFNELSPGSILNNEKTDVSSLPPAFVWSMMTSAMCNNSDIRQEEDGKWKRVGDSTEVALLVAATKAKMDRNCWINHEQFGKVGEFAFDSDRKLMSSLYSSPQTADKTFILVKGAPEEVLENCVSKLYGGGGDKSGWSQSFDVDQSTSPVDDTFIEQVSRESSSMAASGLRVLGLALRVVTSAESEEIINSQKSEFAETKLIFIGLIGMLDPPRQGIKDSISLCHKAGIDVIMITGDHIITAMAIAESIGIIDDSNRRVMKGVELDILSDDALKVLKPFPRVFARVSPDNKLKIVQALQQRGESVAMTGDGTNDAAAIKAANVGIAMGIGGTEITKQAADVVLADDNFSTIVVAVQEGRRVFDNIQKFVVYLLSCNFAEIITMLFSQIVGVKAPFTAIMILYANIIADIPPSMSMGIEPAEVDVMERPPRNPNAGVLNWTTGLVILAQSSVMGFIALGIYLWDLGMDGDSSLSIQQPKRAQTHTYFLLTTLQLVQSFLSRSVESSVFVTGIFQNRYMVAAFIVSFSFMIMAVYIPGFAEFLGLVPLVRWEEWVSIIVAIVIQVTLNEIMKLSFRTYHRYRQRSPRKLQSNMSLGQQQQPIELQVQ
ncbi:hypothetical protein MP228_000328 [Amoeboaphelidium protococcarum]|nr:hypothetical protein MP228_000328 [Amoeboaphelidium protococcarum]